MDDLKHAISAGVREQEVAGMTLGKLFVALGTAQMLSHRWITEQLLQQDEVTLVPWLDMHRLVVGPVAR